MADIADLERRVIALEAANNEHVKTLHWVVGTLGRVAADLSTVKEEQKATKDELGAFRKEFQNFQDGFPSTVAEVMRDVIRDQRT